MKDGKMIRYPVSEQVRPVDEARKQIQRINAEITADDKGFKNAVRIVHGDGSTFILNYAFIVRVEIAPISKNWRTAADPHCFIGVVAEHHLPLVFAEDELDQYDEYKMTLRQFRK